MTAELERVVGLLERFAEAGVIDLSLEVTANLIEKTPRDTGWAAANWIPTLGVPFAGVAGSRLAVSEGAQQSGIAAIATGYRLPGIAWVVNNVHYIVGLNQGNSAQAGAAFVQAEIERAMRSTVRTMRASAHGLGAT